MPMSAKTVSSEPRGQAGDQDPGDQVADVRGGEPRDRAEHNAHQPDQTDQRVLDCLVGSGQQQPGGQPADDERQRLPGRRSLTP